MTIVVADLVARLREEGVQQTAAAVKAVGQEAATTARALEIMAQNAAKVGGGTAAGWAQIFQQSGALPTQAALAQATAEMQKTAAAHTEAATAAQRTTAAVTAAVAPAQAAAAAAADHATGWRASESSVVRFGAALGVATLGFSTIAGAARLVVGAVGDIMTSQLDWERSLKNLSGLYGETGVRAAALANAQALLPGVLGTQQEFAQAAINASALTMRYGLPQRMVDQMTTTGGRVAFATGMTDPAERAQLQAQILAAVQTGAPLPARYGTYVDDESLARRLGGRGAQALEGYTPQQLMAAREAVTTSGLTDFADRAAANQRAALETATRAAQVVTQAQTNLQSNLEGTAAPGVIQGPTVAQRTLTRSILEYGAQPAQMAVGPGQPAAVAPTAANLQGMAAIDAEQRVLRASQVYAVALADSAKAQDEARKTIEALGQGAAAAVLRLRSFFGSAEDPNSILRGDIAAQAQGAVATRSIGPNPLAFQTPGDLRVAAQNAAGQQAWQTYTAALGQQMGTNAIRTNLEQIAAQPQAGPGLNEQRTAAQQALAEMTRREPAALALRNAEQADALAQLSVAERQSNVEAIALQYRERSLLVERDTLGIRTTAVQISLQNLTTAQALIQAQQAALPSGLALSNLTYEQQRTALLAQTRTAGLLTGQDVSGIPSYDDLIRRSIVLRYQTPGVALAALDATQAVTQAGFAATAGGLAAGAAQIPITRASLDLTLKELADDPRRLAATQALVGAQVGALATGRGVRSATTALANVALTVNVGGTVRLADDAITSAAQSAYDLVEQALREGLSESDQSGVPASPQLAGARR